MDSERIGLVADIGRHSVRFALTGGADGLAPRDVRSFHTADYATFTNALLAYTAELGMNDQPLSCVLAIAGMTRGDLINLTGSRWFISLSGVEAVLRQRPIALNEAAACAMALTQLPSSAMLPIGSQPARPVQAGGNYVLVSIGTGLGVAGLVTSPGGRLAPVQGEAGHMAFAPRTADELRFANAAERRGPVSAETLLSAPGLIAAYAALSSDRRALATPEDVTRGVGRDPACDAVTRMAAGYLGSFIGDVVLAFGAWDGVYITGAVGRALQRQIALPDFRQRMENKGFHRRKLSEVPVSLVTRDDLELLGAAAIFAAD